MKKVSKVLTNQKRVFRILTNQKRVFKVLTNEKRKRIFRILTIYIHLAGTVNDEVGVHVEGAQLDVEPIQVGPAQKSQSAF